MTEGEGFGSPLSAMQFPCFMYHAVHGAKVFRTPEEYAEAGSGWVDTPAKLAEPQEAPEPVKRGPGRPKKTQ
jgi:hypothetical protein